MLRLPFVDARRAGPLAVAAALLSAGAAAIHVAVAGPHFEEYAPFGLLFAATALAQAAWAALVVTAPTPRLLAAGAATNAAIVGAWTLSRTIGLPVGSGRWTPEPVAPPDVVAAAFELGIVAAAVALLGAPPARPTAHDLRRVGTIGAAAVVALVGAALAQGRASHQHGPGDAEHAHVHAG